MADPLSEGYYNLPGSKDVPRTPSDKVAYEMGQRMRGPRTPRAVTPEDIEEAKGWLRWSLILGAVGAVAGCGYGIWLTLSSGFGFQAAEVLKWTGIGAAAGALLPVGLVVALGVGIIAAILWGLGQLLNLLTSL